MRSPDPGMNEIIIATPVKRDPAEPAATAATPRPLRPATPARFDPFLESSPDWLEIDDEEGADMETEAELTLSGAEAEEANPTDAIGEGESGYPVHPWSVSVMAFDPTRESRSEEGEGEPPRRGRGRLALWAGTMVRRLRAPFIRRPGELPFVVDAEVESGEEAEAEAAAAAPAPLEEASSLAAELAVEALEAGIEGEAAPVPVSPPEMPDPFEEQRTALLQCGDLLTRLVSLTSSPRFEGLPREARALSVRLALEVAGIDADVLCADLRQMRSTLQRYDSAWQGHLESLAEAIQQRNAAIEAVTERFVQAQKSRLEANNKLLEEARSSFTSWQAQKLDEEGRLARILAALDGLGEVEDAVAEMLKD